MSNSPSNLVRYGSFDETALEEQSRKVNDLAGQIFVKIEPGDNIFRFLPPPPGKNTPFRVTAMHYIDAVPGLDKQLVFACPRHESRTPCLACQKADELSRSANPHDRERGQKIAANLRVYAAVVQRNDPDMVPKVLSFGKQIFDQLKAIRKNPRLGGDFTNPTEQGFDIIISRAGTGKNDTKYVVSADRNNSALHPDPTVIQQILDAAPNLELQVNPIVPEQLFAMWGEVAMRGGPAPSAPQGPSRWSPPAAPAAHQPPITTTGRAVQDAQEFDDDFNPIKR